MPNPAQLAALHLAAAPPDMRAWGVTEFTELLAQPSTICHMTDAGFALSRLIADEAELLMIATHPDHRRKGAAWALLMQVESDLITRGAAMQFLEVADDNAPARALYVRAGYEQVGRRKSYYPRAGGARVDALVLQKPL